MGSSCRKDCSDDKSPVSQRNWCKTYLTLLRQSMGARDNELWFKETEELVRSWDKQIVPYINHERWDFIVSLHLDSDNLKYIVNKRDSSQCNLRNIFDMLHADFFDLSNPIADLLSTFSAQFLKEFNPSISADLESKRPEIAEQRILSMSTTLLKYTQIITPTVISFYSIIEVVLANKRKDLEGLVLAHLIKGDMYHILEDLASLSLCDKIRLLQMKTNHGRDTSFHQFGVSPEEFPSTIELICREAEDVVMMFATSENLYEKLTLLLYFEELMERCQNQCTRLKLVAWILVRSGLFLLPAHLYVTQLFFVDTPKLMQEGVNYLIL